MSNENLLQSATAKIGYNIRNPATALTNFLLYSAAFQKNDCSARQNRIIASANLFEHEILEALAQEIKETPQCVKELLEKTAKPFEEFTLTVDDKKLPHENFILTLLIVIFLDSEQDEYVLDVILMVVADLLEKELATSV